MFAGRIFNFWLSAHTCQHKVQKCMAWGVLRTEGDKCAVNECFSCGMRPKTIKHTAIPDLAGVNARVFHVPVIVHTIELPRWSKWYEKSGQQLAHLL